MTRGFIPVHGGYKRLLSYQRAEIVYLATVYFCERFIDRDSSESGESHKGFSQITGNMDLVPSRPTLSLTWTSRDEGTRTIEEWTGSGYETRKVKFSEVTIIVITGLPDALDNKDIIPLPFAESFFGGSGHVQVTYTYTQEDNGTGQNNQTITIVSAAVTGVGCWFNQAGRPRVKPKSQQPAEHTGTPPPHHAQSRRFLLTQLPDTFMLGPTVPRRNTNGGA